MPVTYVSHIYDFKSKAAQASFDNYRNLSVQLANRQILNNFSTGCLLGTLVGVIHQKLADKITTKQVLIGLVAGAAGVSILDYDPKSDLPTYDLQTLEAYPSTGEAGTILGNTLVASVFAFASYLTTQGLLAR